LNVQTSPALVIISAMITPALLILGSGSLVATALLRLGRAVDRARALLLLSEQERQKLGCSEQILAHWLDAYARRAFIAERAVLAFFIAVGTFVLDCLSIAVDRYAGNRLTWLPVSLTIGGMLMMLCGAYCMVVESRLGGIQIREEIQRRLPASHKQGNPGPPESE
jgi:hypothetical protein